MQKPERKAVRRVHSEQICGNRKSWRKPIVQEGIVFLDDVRKQGYIQKIRRDTEKYDLVGILQNELRSNFDGTSGKDSRGGRE